MHSEKTKRKISESMKGKKHSLETRKKISESRKGFKHSEETKRKLSKPRSEKTKQKISKSLMGTNHPMYGRKWSGEIKKKMSESQKGRKHSKETKRKLSILVSGKNHPNWKGGISCEQYCDVWSDKEYKEDIKERDGHQCLNPCCSKKSNRFGIHHIDYNKKNCKPNNLITLCVSCNSKANFDRDWYQSWYNIIIEKRYG